MMTAATDRYMFKLDVHLVQCFVGGRKTDVNVQFSVCAFLGPDLHGAIAVVVVPLHFRRLLAFLKSHNVDHAERNGFHKDRSLEMDSLMEKIYGAFVLSERVANSFLTINQDKRVPQLYGGRAAASFPELFLVHRSVLCGVALALFCGQVRFCVSSNLRP